MKQLATLEWKTTGVYLGRLKQCILLCACLVVLPVQSATCNTTGTRTMCRGGHKSLPQGEIPTTVTDLDVSRNELKLIDENTLRHFLEIRKLNISRNVITNIHNKAFFLLTGMETLDLSFNHLKEIHDNILYNNAKLKWFSLANNVNLKYIPQLQSKSLVRFNVSNCSVQSMNETTFQEVESITVLDLSFNQLTEIRHHTFDALTSLYFLDVSNNKLQHVDFINSDCALSVTYLDISSNYISHLDLMTFQTLLSLKTIRFQNNPWQCDESMKIVYENMLKREFTLNLMCVSPNDHKAMSWHEWYSIVNNTKCEGTQNSYFNCTVPLNQTILQNCTKSNSNCAGLSYATLTVSAINMIIIIILLVRCYKRKRR